MRQVTNTAFLLSLAIQFLRAEEIAHPPIPIADARLDNAHRLTEKVLTGAEPHGESAMAALKELGVKTIISVDGSTPDVELARKFGLRYVHLPIGYDGVPAARSLEIAKALQELDGPIYVHCHHGMHRGPAAAATACVVAGMLNNDEALAAMKKLGTGDNYIGLWNSARTAKAVSSAELKAVNVEYREVSPILPLAEAMVHADELFDHLGLIQKAGWKAPAAHPDLDPAHEALKLRELFTELNRTGDTAGRVLHFRNLMKEQIQRAQNLEETLSAEKKDEPSKELDKAYSALQDNCKACHKLYRNNKP